MLPEPAPHELFGKPGKLSPDLPQGLRGQGQRYRRRTGDREPLYHVAEGPLHGRFPRPFPGGRSAGAEDRGPGPFGGIRQTGRRMLRRSAAGDRSRNVYPGKGRGMEAAAADRIQTRFLGRVLPRRTGRTVEQSLRVVRHDAQGVRRQGNELLLPDRRSGDPGRSGSAGSRRGSFHHRRDDRSVGIHGRRHPGSPEIRRTGSSGRLLFRKNPFAGTTRG